MTEIDGLTAVTSPHTVAETVDRLAAAVEKAGLAVLARIDHAAAAAKVGMDLRPTTVLLFGRPEGGTPLMQERQTAGIDLPLTALGWEDEAGQVWLGWNEPSWIAARHDLTESATAVEALARALATFAAAATAP
ncbi:hypothetical protein PSU4_33440 [Pseudonocardia sulfidoxydans NBRC 16205]|uniref:DUF302 domain-containing protein n=1 Tax=Pseudonocardia sulfidoxydans NBRC 16205 TaxID=1223511 RepID=A0A511DHX2_9PSEU|nr:DUF302 domain-containing protein [Pseudonocardia sulfidoxydans]GEL24390.1 hypothetical protein PSU4_33440 [Pseudonocardia sulfidoxydans NBRC 16205]